MLRKLLVQMAVSQGDLGALPLERALLTPRQTAAALKISRRTLLYWTKKDRRRGPKIPFVKPLQYPPKTASNFSHLAVGLLTGAADS